MPALTFTFVQEGTYTPGSGAMAAPSVVSYVGAGIRVRGNPQRYAALELVESEAPTILWSAATYGDPTPPIGATCELGTDAAGDPIVYRVVDVSPVDPDFGGHVLARIVVQRA